MAIIFFLLILAICHAYFGYPLLMIALRRVKECKKINRSKIFPYISVVIPAYNEEASIRSKLENILLSDYPRDKMEIFVTSDASSDRTDNIVKNFEGKGINLYRLKKRGGKIAAYRGILPKLNGEIVVFTDATSMLKKDAISNLISNFSDQTVGCAGGLLLYVNPDKAFVGEGESKYWDYEKRVRLYESELCSLPSVSGTLYAIRKNLYPIDMKDDLADDLIAPIKVFKAGYRTVLAKDAICTEYTTLNVKEDMAKRMRITIQNIRGIIDQLDILNPFKYGLFSLIILSHKVFRLLVPVFLLLLFATSLILSYSSSFFLVILISQVMFYIVGLLGYLLKQGIKLKIVNAIFYFCLVNFSILLGIIKFFTGEKVKIWEPIRA